MEFELTSRPWISQDLLDDLQMYIDEENDNYLNGRRTAMCMARDYLSHYFKAEEEGRLIELPCKDGDTIYRIVKFCGENIGYKEFYRPTIEFEDDCEFFEPVYCAGDCERCNAEIIDGDKERWYCSHNLDILCEKCKERFAIQKDVFTFSKIRQIYNTPMFNSHLSLEDIYYLSLEEAENALKRIISD